MSDVNCPYCGADQDINHDDGYGYAEDLLHDQTCSECEKTFVFETFITTSYEAKKADCLNGAQHKYEPTNTYPKKYTRMRCEVCGDERPCTKDEMDDVLSA